MSCQECRPRRDIERLDRIAAHQIGARGADHDCGCGGGGVAAAGAAGHAELEEGGAIARAPSHGAGRSAALSLCLSCLRPCARSCAVPRPLAPPARLMGIRNCT